MENQREAQIVRLLGEGHSQYAVAQALGISESRLSQILSEHEGIRERIAAHRLEKLQEESELDGRRLTLEGKILEKLERAVPLMALARPMEIARVYQIVNGAKTRAVEAQRNPEQAGMQVTVLMPASTLGAKFQMKLSPKNEVLEIEEGRPLVTATPSHPGFQSKEIENDQAGSRKKISAESPRLGEIALDQI